MTLPINSRRRIEAERHEHPCRHCGEMDSCWRPDCMEFFMTCFRCEEMEQDGRSEPEPGWDEEEDA